MSNTDIKISWEKWYPEEIILSNFQKNHDVFWNKNIFKETDFFVNKEELSKKNKKLDKIKEIFFDDESYFLKKKQDLKDQEKTYILLNKKLKDLSLNFEHIIDVFEKTLFSRLLKTILIISSYIIGEKFLINESILLKNINKIIQNDNFFLKKPKLVVHPSNKNILEKIFKDSISGKWELIYNKNIDVNSFKIQSENNNIDATVYARWKEVYRVILENGIYL